MSSISLNTPAPDFTLSDFNGKAVSLSDYRGKSNVVLVMNRGFL
jgi:peroxiredoxin